VYLPRCTDELVVVLSVVVMLVVVSPADGWYYHVVVELGLDQREVGRRQTATVFGACPEHTFLPRLRNGHRVVQSPLSPVHVRYVVVVVISLIVVQDLVLKPCRSGPVSENLAPVFLLDLRIQNRHIDQYTDITAQRFMKICMIKVLLTVVRG